MMCSPRTNDGERDVKPENTKRETPMKSSKKVGTPATTNTPAAAATQTVQAHGAKVKINKKKAPVVVSKESVAPAAATKTEAKAAKPAKTSGGPSKFRSVDTF